MAGGFTTLVKRGKTNVYVKRQPTFSKTRRYRSKYSKYRGRFASTGLKSLLGLAKFLQMVYKVGWKDTLTTAQVSNSRFFRMNSVYDPDYLSILPPTKNKLCEGMTELTTLFNRYQVYYCKCIVTAQNMADYPMRVVLSPTNDSTVFASSLLPSDVASRSGAKSRIIGPAGSSNDKVVMTYYYNPRKAIGITKNTFGQDIFSAPMNASPAVVSALAITWGSIADTIPPANSDIYFDVRFVYGTRFYDITENLDE